MSDIVLRVSNPKPLIIGLFGFALLWIVASATIGLAEDEAYYWTWSKNLQWGYYDHAPMVAWWVRAGTAIFGDTTLGVRFIASLATLTTAFAMWRTVAILVGKDQANLCTLVYCALPMVIGNAVVITPDAPAMLFWALTVWAVAERLASGNRNWWLVAGFFVGLGLLSKYSVLFLGTGLLLCVITSRELRSDLLRWQIWIGGIIAVLLFTPVIWWNANHEWVSFMKQAGRVGQGNGYDPRYFPEFLGAAFVLFHPAAVILGGIGLVRYASMRDFVLSRSAHLAVSTSLPFLVYLIWHAQFARVQGGWPAPLCFAFVLGLATVLMMPKYERLSKSIVPIGAFFALVFFAAALSPIGYARGEVDKTNQLRGWDVFSEEVQALATRENLAWIATSSYATTAQLRWALRNNPNSVPVIQLNERSRYSFEAHVEPALIAKPALFVERARLDFAFLSERFDVQMPLKTLTRGIGGKAGEYLAIRLSRPKAEPLSP